MTLRRICTGGAEQVVRADNTCASFSHAGYCSVFNSSLAGKAHVRYHDLRGGKLATIMPLLGLVLPLSSGVPAHNVMQW
jgi:hypothetical protein